MRRLTTLFSALVVGLGVVALPSPPAQADEPPLLWGAHPNTRAGETKGEARTRVLASAQRDLGAVRQFYLWHDDVEFPTAVDRAYLAEGTTLVISVKPKIVGASDPSWREIADAAPGSAIHDRMVSWARKVRDIDVPVYVTLNHEPEAKANLDRGDNTDYLAAWRAWVSVFRAQGATNARFMWIMTDQSFWLHRSDRRAAEHWYPGDEWVDGIAGDAYNWSDCRPGIWNPWRSLEQIIAPQRDFWLDHQSEELWLTEFGTVEDDGQPGRKADWFRDARALFARPDFAHFDGVMLFESVRSSPCTWAADTSTSAEQAWADWGADPYYGAMSAPGAPEPEEPEEPEEPGEGTDSVVLVTRNPADLGPDAAALARLRTAGYDVTVVDDNNVDAASVASADAVLVSMRIAGSALGARLRSSDRPLVVWKPSVYDELGLAPGQWGTTVKTQELTIDRDDHPLAAGLTGTVAHSLSRDHVAVGTPASGADVIARANGAPTLFAYERGSQMSGLVAPGCRIAAPIPRDGVSSMTGAGLAIFDQVVEYAVAGCG